MTTNDVALLPNLITAVRDQRAVLFLGAGASMEARDSNGKRPPSTNELRNALCEKFLGEDLTDYKVTGGSEVEFEIRFNRRGPVAVDVRRRNL